MKDNKKVIFYMVLTTIGIIIVILGVFLLNKEPKNSGNTTIDNRSVEEIIKENYEFRENDAINLIKKIFHSDNYEFKAKVNNDGLYEVTVTNTINDSKYIYYVDPATKTYRIIEK